MSGKPLLEKAAPATPADDEENRGPPLDKRGVAGAIVICALVAAGIVVLCVYYIRRAPHDDAHGVTAVRLGSTPVISRANSAFDYSYNPASFVVPAPGAGAGGWLRGGDSRAAAAQGQHYLLVRVQNYNHSVGPYAVGPSMMALAPVSGPLLNHSDAECSKVVFQPQFPFEKCGTEDPRVVQHGGVTYLFYTAYDCSKAALSLATTLDPTDPEGWTRHGPLFPSLKWSKSGAVLIRDSPPHYMFFGDSTLVPGLRIATSDNLVNWTIMTDAKGDDRFLIKVRNASYFDSHLVEGGPPPVLLSNGNYLFIYNSARAGFPSPKPGYDLQYNPGYVILAGADPTQVLERSDTPLLTPTLPWEVGNNTAPPRSLTPNVIFMEARFPVPGRHDSFVFYYGAADTNVGAAVVNVTVRPTSE